MPSKGTEMFDRINGAAMRQTSRFPGSRLLVKR
jgi:hypothetical protein